MRVTSVALGVGLVVLLSAMLWVFMYLPDRVTTPTVVLAPEVRQDRSRPLVEEPEVAPYEATQRERARQQAQESLSRFVELQIMLEEDMHVWNWGAEAFQHVLDTAHQGDRLFIDQKYDEALANYDAGSEALRELVERGDTRFALAMDAGVRALDARDAERAAEALAAAADIYPDAAPLEDALKRLEVLPNVQAALRDAQRARDRGEYEAALTHFETIRNLDPATPGVRDQIAELNGILSEQSFDALLSAGYSALGRARYDDARASFAKALEMRPSDTAAIDGQRQVSEAKTLARIEALRARATQMVQNENWSAAEAAFAEILGIDANLQFAREGRNHAARMAELSTAIDRVLNDPGRLSAPAAFTDAVALFRRAVDEFPQPGPRLSGQLDRMEATLADAAEPVSVEFTSDGQTRITVSHVGEIGSFERRTLDLRPGRYVLTGSRNGCRDVRKEVMIGRNTDVIDIRCEQQI
jgi:tetratricopeptide (TPR) repeat protein